MGRPYRLNQGFVDKVKQPSRYGDGRGGNGLSLLVKPLAKGGVSKTWWQRYRDDEGKLRTIGLGHADGMKLDEARRVAWQNAEKVQRGEDPREVVRNKTAPTLRKLADEFIAAKRNSWKSPRTEKLIRSRLETHAAQLLDIPVDRIDSEDVIETLAQISTPPTQHKVRDTLRLVFDKARARRLRGDNPADMSINSELAPLKGTTHQPAIPYAEMPAALHRLEQWAEQNEKWPALALIARFLALTCCRSGEVRGATWDEVDMDARLWSIPATRMKTSEAFQVPLSVAALDVLREAEELRDGSGLVFPSAFGKVVGTSEVSEAFRKSGFGGVPHGLRSSFRDWAGDTGIDREVAEAVLSHKYGSKVELAYKRTAFLTRRIALMEQWAAVVEGREVAAAVVQFTDIAEKAV